MKYPWTEILHPYLVFSIYPIFSIFAHEILISYNSEGDSCSLNLYYVW